jgi:hypothetical protein
VSAPTFIASGANASSTASPLAVAYPAGLQADNTAIGFPAGWTPVAQIDNTAAFSSVWAWKRLDGTESGTIDVTTGTAGTSARMGIFRGCLSYGTPYEDVQTATGNDANPTSPAAGITVAAVKRLGLVLWTARRNVATTNADGTWTEAWDSGGLGVRTVPDTKQIDANEGGSDVRTIGTANPWSVWSLALKPDYERMGFVRGGPRLTSLAQDSRQKAEGFVRSGPRLFAPAQNSYEARGGALHTAARIFGTVAAAAVLEARSGILRLGHRLLGVFGTPAPPRSSGTARGAGSTRTITGLGDAPQSRGTGSARNTRGLGE